MNYECMIDEKWYDFKVLEKGSIKDGIADKEINKRLLDLPNIVYGKYCANTEGYHPTGCTEYVFVSRNTLRYKKN